MSTGIAIIILMEALVALGIIYGFAHEDRVIEWEKRIGRRIRRYLCEKWLNRGEFYVVTKYGK